MQKRKTGKRIFIAVLAVLLVLAVIALLNGYPMLAMKPLETGAIQGTDVIAVKDNINNLYFMETEEGYLLIDAGTNLEKVSDSMDQLGIVPENVRYILLTHSDYDHVGALPLFPNAQIYMSEDETQMLDGTTKRNTVSSNSLPDGVDINGIVLLADEETLTLGGYSIRCIKSPGHTFGSMSFLVNDEYLFTGDAFRPKDIEWLAHPFTMDESTAIESIIRLREVAQNAHITFTAHYGFF